MSQLALYLLGPPRVELDGEEIHISRRKAVALLAYLAVTRRPSSRDSVATLLWPKLDQSTARARLRRALAALREAIGDDWVDADRDTISLNPDAEMWLDVDAFHDQLAACGTHGHPPTEACPDCIPLLEEAVALYRDHFLAGFTLRDSAAFDEVQFFQTEALKDRLADALRRLVRYHSDREEHAPAIELARRWLALDPFHEPAHRHLMKLYARAGQAAAALRQYQLLERTLAEELDVPPSAETTVLFERIRSGEELGGERGGVPFPAHNLPPQPTPFIGRKAELADLDRLIADPDVRLITIVGPGGMGKTRLAIAAAERQLSRRTEIQQTRLSHSFPDGVFFVSLAPLSEIDQIVYRLADALNLQLQGDAQHTRTPKQQILDYLRQKRILILMDSFEHLLDGAELLSDILRTAPEVQILVTSRERLHVQAEQVYPIRGLEFPDWEAPEDAADYTAALLFRQSARRVRPDFELSGGEDGICLARICRLVGGMPLALELAAGWVDVLSLAEIAAEIQRGLDFLETDLRDVPARQRGIRAVFDTTWRRLTEAEREAVARFSVFQGGCTREAAQAVTGASLRMLARLSDKSLIQYQKADGRYQIHELLRQYAGENLAQDPEAEITAQKAHCAYYCTALQEWKKALKSPRQPTAEAEITADYQNIRAAWDLAVEQANLHHLRTAVDGLGEYYIVSDRVFTARAVFEKAAGRLQAVHGLSPATAEAALLLARLLAWRAGFRPVRIISYIDEDDEKSLRQSLTLLASPALTREDTRHEEAFDHFQLGVLLRRARSPAQVEEGRNHLETSLRLYQALGDQVGIADVLHMLSWYALYYEGTLEQSKRFATESLALRRQMGQPQRIVWSLGRLGDINRWGLMAYDEAFEAYQEAYAIAQASEDLPAMADARENTAVLAWFLGEFDLALDALEEALNLSQQAGQQYRAAFYQLYIGLTQAYRGRFPQAEALIQGVVTDQRLDNDDKLCLALVHIHRGQYEAGRAQAGMVTDAAGGGYNLAWPLRLLSWAALAREDYAEALALSQQSLESCQTLTSLKREWVAWSQASLGPALHGLGRHNEAKQVLFQALQTCVEMRAFLPLMHLMPIIPVVLVEDEDDRLKERAIELYELAKSIPFVANSRLFEDIAGRHIRNAAANMPPEVVAAAQERGRALDLDAAVRELLEELE